MSSFTQPVSRSEPDIAQYCPVCGIDAGTGGTPVSRFGAVACSPDHADRFVAQVTAERTRQAAMAGEGVTQPRGSDVGCAMHNGTGPSWRRWLVRGLCWGGPALAVGLYLGGDGLWSSAAGILPYAALLACPVGMGVMMWMMNHMPPRGQPGQPAIPERNRSDAATPPKEPVLP